MRRLAAVAELRFREAVAARIFWLVPVAFLAAWGCAEWVPGPTAATRAALADRIVLLGSGALALLAAAVLSAAGFAGDVRTQAAQTLTAAPVTRLSVLLGGALGHGAASALLLFGLLGAGLLGLEAGGLGAGVREPVRRTVGAEAVETGRDGVAEVSAASPAAGFRFRAPAGVPSGAPLRLRFAPRMRIEGEHFGRETTATVTLEAPGSGPEVETTVSFQAGRPFAVALPMPPVPEGTELVARVRRDRGSWALRFHPGSAEVGGAPVRFTFAVLVAGLCALPALFVAAAAGSFASARFAAPTALGLSLFLLLGFLAQGFFESGADYVLRAAAAEDSAHDHAADHAHPISPLQRELARAARAATRSVPDVEHFDGSRELAAGRALELDEPLRAAVAALPPLGLLVAAGWLLLRRREL